MHMHDVVLFLAQSLGHKVSLGTLKSAWDRRIHAKLLGKLFEIILAVLCSKWLNSTFHHQFGGPRVHGATP